MFVEDARHHSPLREAFLRAGQWLGYDVVDQNAGSQAGFAPYQFNIHRGGEMQSKSSRNRTNLKHPFQATDGPPRRPTSIARGPTWTLRCRPASSASCSTNTTRAAQ